MLYDFWHGQETALRMVSHLLQQLWLLTLQIQRICHHDLHSTVTVAHPWKALSVVGAVDCQASCCAQQSGFCRCQLTALSAAGPCQRAGKRVGRVLLGVQVGRGQQVAAMNCITNTTKLRAEGSGVQMHKGQHAVQTSPLHSMSVLHHSQAASKHRPLPESVMEANHLAIGSWRQSCMDDAASAAA